MFHVFIHMDSMAFNGIKVDYMGLNAIKSTFFPRFKPKPQRYQTQLAQLAFIAPGWAMSRSKLLGIPEWDPGINCYDLHSHG